MKNFFAPKIENLEDWAQVFTNAAVFTPLVASIFLREQLPFVPLKNTTPGTNAVFRVGENIIKVFAPQQCETNGKKEYENEVFWLKQAVQLGIRAPEIIAFGEIKDKYLFHYIIMEYLPYPSFNKIKQTLTVQQKKKIALQLKSITEKISGGCRAAAEKNFLAENLNNKGWDGFSPRFLKERNAFLKNLPQDKKVFVHGDLTGDNILIDAQENVYIIDFADAKLAPRCYELPPLVLDAFSCDHVFLEAFFGDDFRKLLEKELLKGLMMHEYGGDFVRDYIGEEFREISKVSQIFKF